MASAFGGDPDFAKYFAKSALPARTEKFSKRSSVITGTWGISKRSSVITRTWGMHFCVSMKILNAGEFGCLPSPVAGGEGSNATITYESEAPNPHR